MIILSRADTTIAGRYLRKKPACNYYSIADSCRQGHRRYALSRAQYKSDSSYYSLPAAQKALLLDKLMLPSLRFVDPAHRAAAG
eukprot:SM000021S06403  [mRNA]  locus=s21:25950:27047:+ [translate_table: standard]